MKPSRIQNRRQPQSGFVLLTMAVAAIAMIGAMGLAIDLGHVYIVKNETQAYVDAAAIAAGLQMDGTTAGITRASNAAGNLAANWNFDSSTLTSPTVEFEALASGTCPSSGTWYSAANVTTALAPTMACVRVAKTVAPSIFFIPVVLTTPVYTQNVTSTAIAGQIAVSASTSIPEGLGPFTGIASCSGTVAQCEASAPDFGLSVGQYYDIQWPQYNSSRSGCGLADGNNGNGKGNGNGNKTNDPSNCFVSPPCPGDGTLDTSGGGTTGPEAEVITNWGSAINGYWGSNSTSKINSYILDTQQLAALSIGTDITPDLANGDKQGSAKVLDDRVNQDVVNYDPSGDDGNAAQTLADYLANTAHNGRRMLPIPMVYPNSTGSQVVGYGLMLLVSNVTAAGSSSTYYAKGDKGVTSDGTGNAPYCGIFAGPWVMGATNGGVTSTSGVSRVRLVQ